MSIGSDIVARSPAGGPELTALSHKPSNGSARLRLPPEAYVDDRYPAARSIVLRYRNAFTFGALEEDARFKELLVESSIAEGVRIFPLLDYKGVHIAIMDETSLMHTHTLKSIDGCVTTARCKLQGLETVVLETGGNTGSALTAYGSRAGLETFCFIPEENIPLLNSAIFAGPKAHLISVEDPGMVKHAAHLFATENGLRHIPETPWRYEAARFRGLFILEHMVESGRIDWIAQTISAAFGPVGIYQTLRTFGKELDGLPRFLGIQQEANCPMYRSWKAKRRTLKPVPIDSTVGLLAKAMYDVKPHTYGTYCDLLDVLADTNGELVTINHEEFEDVLTTEFDGRSIRGLLCDHGIDIGADVVEKTGLMALAGTIKLIDRGGIQRGKRVVCCLTSGVFRGDGQAKPEFRIGGLRTAIGEYSAQLASRTSAT